MRKLLLLSVSGILLLASCEKTSYKRCVCENEIETNIEGENIKFDCETYELELKAEMIEEAGTRMNAEVNAMSVYGMNNQVMSAGYRKQKELQKEINRINNLDLCELQN